MSLNRDCTVALKKIRLASFYLLTYLHGKKWQRKFEFETRVFIFIDSFNWRVEAISLFCILAL